MSQRAAEAAEHPVQWGKKRRTGLLHRHPFERRSSSIKARRRQSRSTGFARDFGWVVAGTKPSGRTLDLYYRKRGSASYIVREVLSVRERERERYRERRKWRHHCRAKIGDEFTLSLAKNSHKWRRVYTFPCQKFALFVSPFTLPVSPFFNGHYCGAEIRNEFTLPLPKNLSLLVRNLSNGASRATSDRKLKTNDQILPSPTVLPIEKLNQINTKNYWK